MKIIFCLPGREFTNNFLVSWTDLITELPNHGIQWGLSQKYSVNRYFVCNSCLGGDSLGGKNQKPFQGKLDYDYIMWIDSDQVFRPDNFFNLLRRAQDTKVDILSGLYLMQDGTYFATVENWNLDFFKKNGHFQFLTSKDIEGRKNIFPVSYTGFGWLLVKKGVFESLDYPWVQPTWLEIGDVKEMTTTDCAFMHRAADKGFKTYIDPTIIVGHEKMMIL
jgi:GT2 family glycosyltransferase